MVWAEPIPCFFMCAPGMGAHRVDHHPKARNKVDFIDEK